MVINHPIYPIGPVPVLIFSLSVWHVVKLLLNKNETNEMTFISFVAFSSGCCVILSWLIGYDYNRNIDAYDMITISLFGFFINILLILFVRNSFIFRKMKQKSLKRRNIENIKLILYSFLSSLALFLLVLNFNEVFFHRYECTRLKCYSAEYAFGRKDSNLVFIWAYSLFNIVSFTAFYLGIYSFLIKKIEIGDGENYD